MTVAWLSNLGSRILLAGAALAIVLAAGALAQDEAPETAPGPGAKDATSAFKATIVNLVYKSVNLGGKVVDLAIREAETEVRIEVPREILFDFDKATLRRTAP